jgi:hypothetical protein
VVRLYSHKILPTVAHSPFSDTQGPSIIYTVAEVDCRLIPNREGVTTLVGRKGTKIGSFPSTLAAYFVDELVASPGLKPTDYTVVWACAQLHREGQATPVCSSGRTIAVIGTWEPTVQLSINAIRESHLVIFRNKTVYREVS